MNKTFPQIMLGWLHLSEAAMSDPPKPINLDRSVEVQDLITKFVAVAELASKQLEKIEDCTEKTPSHKESEIFLDLKPKISQT